MTEMSAADRYAEQAGFFAPDAFGHKITMIGAGGIGGTLGPVLATLGVPEIEIYDHDSVVDRNLASTLTFGTDDVGLLKVEALGRELRRLGVPRVTTHAEAFDGNLHRSTMGSIVISGVDSMLARQEIWRKAFTPLNERVALYIDCGTNGQTCRASFVRPWDIAGDVAWYEQFQLRDDPPVAQAPACGETVIVNNRRNVTFAPVALAAIVSSRLARFSRGEPTGRMVAMDVNTLQFNNID